MHTHDYAHAWLYTSMIIHKLSHAHVWLYTYMIIHAHDYAHAWLYTQAWICARVIVHKHDKGWVNRVSEFASEARRASTRLGTRWGGPRWWLTVRKSLSQISLDWAETFLLFAYIYEWILTLRPGGKYGRVSQEISDFVYTPPLLHTPFNSSWCYILINQYY